MGERPKPPVPRKPKVIPAVRVLHHLLLPANEVAER